MQQGLVKLWCTGEYDKTGIYLFPIFSPKSAAMSVKFPKLDLTISQFMLIMRN